MADAMAVLYLHHTLVARFYSLLMYYSLHTSIYPHNHVARDALTSDQFRVSLKQHSNDIFHKM